MFWSLYQAQACPEGCPKVYQTPLLSITRWSTSQCTQRVNSSRSVFSFTATSDSAICSCKVTSAYSPCFEGIPPNSCYSRDVPTPWGCTNQAQSCAWQRAVRVHSNPGSHSRTSLTHTTEQWGAYIDLTPSTATWQQFILTWSNWKWSVLRQQWNCCERLPLPEWMKAPASGYNTSQHQPELLTLEHTWRWFELLWL